MRSHSPSWFLLSSEATADIHYGALIPAVIFTALAVSTVLLRWYSRLHFASGSIGLEDYFVTAALLLSIGITGVVGGQFNLDGGRIRNEAAQLSSLSTMLKLVFAQTIFYHLAINLVKVSFTIQYLRLFSLIAPIVHSCYVLLVLILGATAWGVFGTTFLCDPVQRYWDITVSGTCIDAETHFYSTSIIGIVIDWAIFLLPIPVVGRLRLPRRQKMGLLGCFGLGGFICIVAILRLALVREAAHHGKMTTSGTYAFVFSTIEVNVAIICASVLVMKPLFARFIPSIVSEQPVSAREDRRLWRGLTGLDMLEGTAGEDEEEKEEEDGGREMAVGIGRNAARIPAPERAWDPSGGQGVD